MSLFGRGYIELPAAFGLFFMLAVSFALAVEREAGPISDPASPAPRAGELGDSGQPASEAPSLPPEHRARADRSPDGTGRAASKR